MNMNMLVGAVALVASAGVASAQIDSASAGQLANGNYAVQTSYTSFGSGNSLANAKSEFSGANVNILFGGKLGTGFEKLAVFFDTKAGGSSTLSGAAGTNAGGLKFDTEFKPDFAVVLNGDGTNLYMDFTSFDAGGANTGSYIGQVGWSNGGSGVPTGGTDNGVRASINNSGSGISFGFGTLTAGDAASAASYNTGMGLSLPLSLLGITSSSSFKVSAMILGGDGSTLSTQVLGGVGSAIGGYNGANTYDFSTIAGDQYFVIPTPGAMALLGLGGLVALRRKR
jgi:hypothetical protein